MSFQKIFIVFISFTIIILTNCKKTEGDNQINPSEPTPINEVESWITTADQSMSIAKQNTLIGFTSKPNNYINIELDSTQIFQEIDGFGYTLTGGSAKLIFQMERTQREKLLNELFLCDGQGICVSTLRLSVGASDLDEAVFSYDDTDNNAEDLALSKFNLSKDTVFLIPIIKEIQKLNPKIKFMASPWSSPTWMKDSKNSKGGSLLPKYYQVYADYLVKYLQAMKSHGIEIEFLTVQNEPQHGGNNPSMVMSASEQATFVKNNLGPSLKKANATTKLVIWDHNCDLPEYPISILNDVDANKFIDGSAFHLYNGNISALSTVHQQFPNKNLYFTEQWTGSNGKFEGDLIWHTKNVVIGSMNNWSKMALEWNLANNPSFEPHTPGGCTQCKGAITIDGNVYQKNVAFYIIGQISSFVPSGSKRIYSSTSDLPNVAFVTPEGKKVLVVLNEGANAILFNIANHDKKAVVSLLPNSVGTYIW